MIRAAIAPLILLLAAPAMAAGEKLAESGHVSLVLTLGGAILGGLILNVMPCVFPVLSIKALSLARSGETEAQARREALSYTAGTVFICAALGTTLILLRQAGQFAGWAFQLQDVRVIIVLLLLVGAIALNLAGLFELPTISGGGRLAGKAGNAGAFWSGAFAAFVATPCSGPFMGTALGVALLLPAPAAILIFAGLGFGLALPFLLLGFVPGLRRRLPRPGAWMDKLRRALSLPMFVTAIGLAWIAGRQAGVDAMAFAIGAFAIVGLTLWRIGYRQPEIGTSAWWQLLPALILVGAILTALPDKAEGTAQSITAVAGGRETFDEKRLAALRSANIPVFLYFTADWCVTCKVNEKAALERSEVRDAFVARKVVVMVGDWTNGDPKISTFLEKHGRTGVPFYQVYPAGKLAPKVLPQLLTTGTIIEAL